jgi:hypothetical protein
MWHSTALPLTTLQIVDRDSACLNLPNEIAVGVAGANHKSICKFSRADSQKYLPVWRAIKNLVDSALVDSATCMYTCNAVLFPMHSCFDSS